MPSPSDTESASLQEAKEVWRFGHNERTTFCKRFITWLPTKVHDRICNGEVQVKKRGFMPVTLVCGKP